MKYIIALIHCRTGATAIEYGLIAAGISLAIVAATLAFGSNLRGIFTTLGAVFSTIGNSTG